MTVEEGQNVRFYKPATGLIPDLSFYSAKQFF